MNVQAIVAEYLKEHGFEGLCYPGLECSCGNEDLMPCGTGTPICEPGYKIPCDGGEAGGCYGECEFHITTVRPEKPGDE